MTLHTQDEIASYLAAHSGEAVAVRAIGWPAFETLPAGSWAWLDSLQLRAPGRCFLYLAEIMEVSEPVQAPEQRHETVRLFEPAPTQLPGQLSL